MSVASPIYAFGPFVLNPSARLLLRDGDLVPLTPKAFDLLRVLAEHGGKPVSKDKLMGTVWPDTVVDESNLAYQVSTLRKILGAERYIVTIPGQGYQLVEPVQLVSQVETELVVEQRATTTITVEEQRPHRFAIAIPIALAAVAAMVIALWVVRTRPEDPPAPVPARVRTMAVLPFKPIVVSRRDEALEMGMADALIARIGHVREVTVRPLTAVRRYGGLEQDPIAAGRALGVDAVLDGSIQSDGDRIRINARLLRVADSSQLWAGQFDEQFSEIFAVQDSISTRLAEELSWNLTADERKRLQKRDTDNPEAYRAYTIARLHRERMQSSEMDQAIGHFKRAIALDPGYAAAYAALADAYLILPIAADRHPRENFGLAGEAAKKAIALDPASEEGHRVLAGVKFWYDWDWSGSEVGFRRAIELSPGSAHGHFRYAHLLSNIGRHEEALREVREAQRLDPLSPMINTMAGLFAVQAGNVDDGIRQLQHTLEIDPGFWIARLNLAWAYERQGRYDEAIVEAQRARERSGDHLGPLSMIGYLHGVRGETAEAKKALDELLALSRQRYVPATSVARVYMGMGDSDSAFLWLDKACRERDLWLVFLEVDPRWKSLAADPRFEAIRRCVNLPQ